MRKMIPLLICSLFVLTCEDSLEDDVEDLQSQNAQQQALIDSLITVMSNQQTLMDSLNTVQNTLNTDQQAYIDSLINLGNVSDSLLQVYTDSLNTVQNAYIDSLHNAQQTTLEALANSALSAGFVETIVFNDTIIATGSDGRVWQDLDLSSFIGAKSSVVLIRVHRGVSDGYINIEMRPNGYSAQGGMEANFEFYSDASKYYFINTDSDGIIEWSYYQGNSNTYSHPFTFTLVFYLNQ